ncbi:MAG: flavodoxin family protein [Bacillota bacterium]
MNKLYVIKPGEISGQLEGMIGRAVGNTETVMIEDPLSIPDVKNKKLLFAVALNGAGYNIPLFQMLSKLQERGVDALQGSQGAILIHSPNEFYTKSMAQNIIFLANQLGCRFPGHPVIEATGNLENFGTWQKQLSLSRQEICGELSEKLGRNFVKDHPVKIEKPKILALHASSRKTSNTLALWQMIAKHLDGYGVLEEFHVANGTIVDCKGCSYTTCLHFGKKNECFYGGTIVQELLPAIEKADAIAWICPNYNDAISAQLMAVINRMTVLYRKIRLYDKSIFAVIVSGNSGSDSVAKQLIGGLTINKGFRLPPYFAITATANDPGTIIEVPGIERKAKNFAEHMMREIMA